MLTSRSIQSLQRETQHALIAAKLSLEARANELSASLALLHATLESSPDCIVALDTTHRVLAWNQRYIQLWNMPLLLMQQGDGAALTRFAANQVEDSAVFVARIEALRALPEQEHCDTFRMRDGRRFERFVAPQRMAGQCVGTVVCWRDVTERQLAQEALLQSQQRLQSLFDNALNAIVLVDRHGRVADVNLAVCELLGYSRQELLGTEAASFLVLPAAVEQPADFWRDLQTHGKHHGLLDVRRKNGSLLAVEFKAAANVLEGLHLCVMSDFSARQQAEQMRVDKEVAEAASQSKSAFLSRMSHELRTPLNAILGFSEVLQGGLEQALTPEQSLHVGRIHRAGEHLLMLIDEVLDVSRIEAGSMAILLQDIDPRDAAQDALRSVNVLAAPAHVDLTLQDPAAGASGHEAPALRVRADPMRLHQVLLNLLSNAVKYNRAGGQVLLRVEACAGRVRFVVSDTGLGMSPVQVQALFQPFNRLGRENSAVQGTGIGLVITRRLVDLMGGSLAVVSVEGQGSEFSFDLESAAPSAVKANEPAAAQARLSEAELRNEIRGTVLYIDDDEVNRLLMEAIFAFRPGVQLHLAVDGASGTAAAAQHRPDLVLVDMRLPDMSGIDVLSVLRAQAESAATPCIAVSANAMQDDIALAKAAGFVAYITKPVSAAALLAEVDHQLNAAARAQASVQTAAPSAQAEGSDLR